MADTLTLPEKTRARLFDLSKAAREGQLIVEKFQQAMITVLEMKGLDPTLNHQIDWETGVITPAEAPTKLTPVKEEAAS